MGERRGIGSGLTVATGYLLDCLAAIYKMLDLFHKCSKLVGESSFAFLEPQMPLWLSHPLAATTRHGLSLSHIGMARTEPAWRTLQSGSMDCVSHLCSTWSWFSESRLVFPKEIALCLEPPITQYLLCNETATANSILLTHQCDFPQTISFQLSACLTPAPTNSHMDSRRQTASLQHQPSSPRSNLITTSSSVISLRRARLHGANGRGGRCSGERRIGEAQAAVFVSKEQWDSEARKCK